MVYHMIVGNIMQEESTLPTQEISVHGGSGSALVIPLLSTIVGEEGISMMQIRDHDEPVGDFKPRYSIVFDNICGRELRAS